MPLFIDRNDEYRDIGERKRKDYEFTKLNRGGASLMRGVQDFFMPKEFRLKWGDYIFKVVFQRGADTIHCWQ